MRKVWCIADSIVSPLGQGSAENLSALLSGRSGIRRYAAGSFGAGHPFCASLFDRNAFDVSEMPLFEQVLLACTRDAVGRSGIDASSPRVRFFLSTTKGDIERIGGHPEDLPLCVPAARWAAALGNPNPPLVVSNACISGLAALLQAQRMLQLGLCDVAVVAGADVHSIFTISGFQSLGALSASPCRPFDVARDGMNLGDGAACLVLCAGEEVPEGAWELVCGAVRNDANHISGPSRTGEGSYNCLRAVLAECSVDELALVSVHGTATRYNDEMESVALSRAGLSELPVCAFKGCFGHTMGAAGILESILCMLALDEGVIPPTPGYADPGVSFPMNVCVASRSTPKRAFVKMLSGFGGCNAAMLFRKNGCA
ncbi:MAG: beta-ketoacyl synthase [Bacteroidales bacterium]|nr:beta-ketoacyl synthase [Bacteroidales bacterium]